MPLTAADANRYRLEIKPVHRALAQPLQTGGGRSIAVRPSVLLKVTPLTGAKPAGYGEAAPLPWFGTESAEAAADALSAIGAEIYIIQCGNTAIQDSNATPPWSDALETVLGTKIANALHAAPCARWALESALRQAGALAPLADCALQQPRATTTSTPTATDRQPAQQHAQQHAMAAANRLPTKNAEPNTARPLPVAALLSAGCAAVPQQLLDAGATAFKIKIGVLPFNDEAAKVSRLLESLHTLQEKRNADCNSAVKQLATAPSERNEAPALVPQFKLRLDANGSLSHETLQQWLHLLEPFAPLVDFIEQPFATGCETQSAAAFAGSPIAFAFDESLTSLPRLIQVAAAFPQATLVIKPSLLGSAEGFLRWRSTQGLAARVVYSSALETGIGFAHALTLAAADPLPVHPVGFGTGSLFRQDGLGPLPQEGYTLQATQPAGNSPLARELHAHMEAVWTQA